MTHATMCGTERGAIARCDWAAYLDDFARRNAGHVVALEVNDPEHGIVSREQGYLLFGTSYNAGSHLVLIVLGETSGRRQHRTRCVPNADRMAVVRDAQGAESGLRIHHDAGETLLTLLTRSLS